MALTLHGTVSDNTVALDRKTATPLIINGDMSISQRGTSTSSITNGNYRTLDRFFINNNNVGSVTNSQSTDVPTGQGFATSFKIAVDTLDTPTGTEWLQCQYRTEAQDLKPLKFNTSSAEGFTISFWVKSAKTGTYTLAINNNDSARGISQTYTINSANTWEKKVLSFAGDTAGAIANDNGIGLILYWILSAGADRKSSPLQTSWGAYDSTAFVDSSQVNLADSTSNDWYITGVQLEVGTFDANSIPDFQFEDRGTSLARCQRYFERITTSGGGDSFGSGVCFLATQGRVDIRYSTVKRANATITFGSAGDFLLQAGSKTQAPSSLSSAGSSLHGFFCHTANTGFTIGHGCVLLDNGTTDATIDVSSEL
jgi:hypothetical protein